MRSLAFALFFVASSPLLLSQPDLRVSGYAVNFPAYQRLNSFFALLTNSDRDQFVDITRVRLRPSVGLWQGGFLMIEYEINATYASAPLLLRTAATTNRRQIADLTWNPVNERHWSVLHYIDRVYVRHSSSIGDFTLGRQRISWGTGRIWNPTDLFNPINPVSYSKLEKDGIDALTVKFVLGNFTDLSIVYNPYDRFRQAQIGGRFRTNTNGTDLSVMGGIFDERIVLGGDFAGSVFDAGIRGEAILSGSRKDFGDNYFKGVLGVDNQFSELLYGLMEYHFNGRGRTREQGYELLALLDGEVLNLGRHFGAVQFSYLAHPLLVLSALYHHSFTDGSGFAGTTAVYSLADEISIALGGQYFFGDQGDEYWYYPPTVYGKIDFYF